MADLQHYEGSFSLGMQNWGEMLLLEVETPFSGEREALKTIRHCCTRQNLSIDVFIVEIGEGRFWSKFQNFANQSTPENRGFGGAPHPIWELRGVFHRHNVQLFE